jgi:hypothetical protein
MLSAARFTESRVEEAALDFARESGYAFFVGPDIAREEPGAKRLWCVRA